MGEIADSLLDGEFDYITGEYIGPGCGYPRTFHGERIPWKKKGKSTLTKETEVVWNYLGMQGVALDNKKSEIVKEWGAIISKDLTKTSRICAKIRATKDDWKEFKAWVKDRLTKPKRPPLKLREGEF